MISFKQKNKGFTLVEMLISVGIFTVMSAIILANYPEFRSRSALDNLTAQVAIVFREAQVYGISVREEGDADFDVGYGVHVDIDSSKNGNKELIIFADKNRDKMFNPGTEKDSDSVVETFTLTGGESITQLCAPSCVDGTIRPQEQSSVTAVFVRPNPDAYFSVKGALDESLPSISLRISNRSGSYSRNVEVFTTGQISVR
jgi:prepilin-type N-terminal cleavage/methylation domain-containing protein